jgi:MFS family permease
MKQNHIKLAWTFWGICTLFYFYEFFVQTSPNVLLKELIENLQLSQSKIALLAGSFGFAYSIMQLPSGVLLDRFGPSRLLGGASILISIGCLLFTGDNFSSVFFGRFLMGLGASFAVIGCMKIAANWFPEDKFAFVLGLTVSVGMAGAFAGGPLISFLRNTLGFTHLFYFLGIIGLVFAACFFIFVKDSPDTNVKDEIITFKELLQGLMQAIKIPGVWIVALYGMCMFGPTIAFCSFWGGNFFALKYGISVDYAGFLTSLVFLGWLIGSPSWGYISDKLSSRKISILIGSPLAAITLFIIIYGNGISLGFLSVLLITFGIASSGFLTSFSIIKEISPKQCSASVMGFMNTMNSIGPALLPYLVGLIVAKIKYSSVEIIQNPNVANLNEFNYGLSPLVFSLILGCFIMFFVPETKCKNNYDK